MKSPKIQPPVIPGLRWRPAADGMWAAKYDIRFLQLESGTPRPVCVHSHDGVLYIHVTPSESDAAAIATWKAGIETTVAEAARIVAIARKRRHDCTAPRHAAAVRETIAEAQALYDKYGAAVRRVTPLLNLIGYQYLTVSELNKLRKLIIECRGYIDSMEEDAVALGSEPTDVHLDDEFVVRAVRKLTALDQDRNLLRNGEGWGHQTTAPGHWCCALLETDSARAIAIGRGLVSHHMQQLKRLGIEPAAVSQGRVAA